MLIETRRKRKRLGGGAFTVADLPRPPRRAATQTPVDAAPVATPRPPHRGVVEETQEEKEEESRVSEPLTVTTVRAPSPPPPRLVDHRVLLSRASRMQLMLLARLRCVTLRRARRAELLDEITRLKSIMASLQSEIDATTRNLESLEQLVHRLQQISFDSVGTSGGGAGLASRPTTATRVAPGTILWTNPALLASDGASSSDTAAAPADQLSRAAEEDARKAKTNNSGDRCRFPSSHPG